MASAADVRGNDGNDDKHRIMMQNTVTFGNPSAIQRHPLSVRVSTLEEAVGVLRTVLDPGKDDSDDRMLTGRWLLSTKSAYIELD